MTTTMAPTPEHYAPGLAERLRRLEEHTGIAGGAPLTLEQRVQMLEMCWVDIAVKLLPHIELLEKLGKTLSDQIERRDAPRSEVPPT